MSLDFIRGIEPEGSVVAVRKLGGGRGYLRLVFFGRQTLADVRKALNGFAPPLCALTIDLRDNAGGASSKPYALPKYFFRQAYHLLSTRTVQGKPCYTQQALRRHARND